MKDYHINIFYSDEDQCYIADIPDLKFCSAMDDSPEDALKEALKAKEAWLEASIASGKKAPQNQNTGLSFIRQQLFKISMTFINQSVVLDIFIC